MKRSRLFCWTHMSSKSISKFQLTENRLWLNSLWTWLQDRSQFSNMLTCWNPWPKFSFTSHLCYSLDIQFISFRFWPITSKYPPASLTPNQPTSLYHIKNKVIFNNIHSSLLIRFDKIDLCFFDAYLSIFQISCDQNCCSYFFQAITFTSPFPVIPLKQQWRESLFRSTPTP